LRGTDLLEAAQIKAPASSGAFSSVSKSMRISVVVRSFADIAVLDIDLRFASVIRHRQPVRPKMKAVLEASRDLK
jgi:hypothetical protein